MKKNELWLKTKLIRLASQAKKDTVHYIRKRKNVNGTSFKSKPERGNHVNARKGVRDEFTKIANGVTYFRYEKEEIN